MNRLYYKRPNVEISEKIFHSNWESLITYRKYFHTYSSDFLFRLCFNFNFNLLFLDDGLNDLFTHFRINLSWIPKNKFHLQTSTSSPPITKQNYSISWFRFWFPFTASSIRLMDFWRKLENSVIDNKKKKNFSFPSRVKRPSKLALKEKCGRKIAFCSATKHTKNWPERFVNDPRDTKYTIALANATY